MTNRDSMGRFTPGNQVAALGWRGLVQRRFGGDEATAKAWVGAIGCWAYGLNYRRADGEYMPWVKQAFRIHPGQPETFAERYQERLDFSLSDVEPLAF